MIASLIGWRSGVWYPLAVIGALIVVGGLVLLVGGLIELVDRSDEFEREVTAENTRRALINEGLRQ